MIKILKVSVVCALALVLVVMGSGCKSAAPSPSLSSIVATPGSLNLTAGGVLPMVIKARYSDGASVVVTNVTYSCSNSTVASIDADGYVKGGTAGSAVVTVSYSEYGVSKTVKVPVMVTGIVHNVPGGAHQSE